MASGSTRVEPALPETRRSPIANAVYGVLNPIAFGCFVATLVFDLVYARSAQILWTKAAAWTLLFGLLAAVVPRLINLTQVWITGRGLASGVEKADFWLNLVAIVLAIFNAFVHSRDGYAVVPAGAWLSALSVASIATGYALRAVQAARRGELP